MSDPAARVSRLRALDPARWRWRVQVGALFLPVLLSGLCLALAPLLPETLVLTHAAKALLLTLPRWAMALWLPWGLLLGIRVRALLPSALVLGIFGLALAGDPRPPGPGEGWKVLSTNVNAYSDDPDPQNLVAAVSALSADLVIAVERRLLEVPGMVRVADNLDEDLPRESHAITVFCRSSVPCEAEVTPEFGSATSKMPMALVRLGGAVCVLGVHAPPPVPFDPSGIDPYVAQIASKVREGRLVADWAPCREGDPVAIAGDFNAVPYSTAWRAVRDLGLRPVLQDRGVFAASWPTGGGWPDLPFFQLEHVFEGALSVSGARLLRMPGTDHKAILWSVQAPCM